MEEELKIRVFQIAIHKDEGHYDKDSKEWKSNHHAHLVCRLAGFGTGKNLKTSIFSLFQNARFGCGVFRNGKGVSGSLQDWKR